MSPHYAEQAIVYLSWKRRQNDWLWSPFGKYLTYSHEVSLVESVRTPKGPRQRHVAYIGRLKEAYAEGNGALAEWHRARLWRRLDACLNRLGNRLPVEERRAIERELGERVPRPDPMPGEWQSRDDAQRVATYQAVRRFGEGEG